MMSPQPTIVLFDIDGTLVSTGGLAREAMQQAVREHYGDAVTFAFSFGGMTDLSIMRRGLQAQELPFERPRVDAALRRYVELLSRSLDGAPLHHRCYDHALQIVTAVAETPGVAAGIGTGNIEPGARLKLAPLGFNPLLRFGGFGEDGEARADLIAAGATRGADVLGCPLHDCALIIVGDTPHDVTAAHANGGICIAVATGTASRAQLVAAGADVVFDNLGQAGVLEAILGGAT